MAAAKDKAPSITFGGKVWPVGALGWEVLAKLFPDVTSIYTGDPETRIRTRLRVIVTALSEQATEEDLRALPTDLAEITIASDAIGVVSGMIRLGEYVQGLDKTTGSPSKAGTNSSPMSAPAPDGHPPKSGG